jgi:hypothetical protein
VSDDAERKRRADALAAIMPELVGELITWIDDVKKFLTSEGLECIRGIGPWRCLECSGCARHALIGRMP